jgi:RimJ/RimL family protein N-acetyltransferase
MAYAQSATNSHPGNGYFGVAMDITEENVGYRPLTEADLPLMHRWLNAGSALEWYGRRRTTLEEIAAEYGPSIRGEDGVHPLALTLRGEPIGYLQWYLLKDEPGYILDGEDPTDAAALDLFLGEESAIGRGYGTILLRKALRELIFADPAVRRCYIDPVPDNTRAIRVYEKVGFRYIKTIPVAWEGFPAYLMAIERSAVCGEVSGAPTDDPDRDQHEK